jgi:beta-lactamase regulating signal transducer with metallopeptidase domain
MTELLKMSLSASALIAAIAALRGIALNWMPKKAFLALWTVAVIRLLIPFTLSSPFSYELLLMDAGRPANPAPLDALLSAVTAADSAVTFTAVWLGGAAVIFAFFVATHLLSRREYKTSLPVHSDFITEWSKMHPLRRRVQIRQSDRISAPFTYGILKPVLLLPKTMDMGNQTELEYVLAHEYTHIRCFDVLKKWILLLAASAHWFNPLAWVMYILANRDIELSCDEAVVRHFGEAAKSPYALALIGLEEKRSRSMYSAFAGSTIETRIHSIMKSRKLTLASVVLAAAIVLAVAAVFATTATEAGSAVYSGVYGPGEAAPADDVSAVDAETLAGYQNDNK